MSKIITKKQLKMVMENTMKEADYMNENEDAIKLTKDHMDKLNKEGHCMCDDKCLIYIEDIAGDVKKMTELIKKIDSEDKDCVFISKEQMDMLHKDGKCECDDNVTLSYDDDMKEGDYMNDMGDDMKTEGDYMNDDTTKESACNECGGTMVEGVCEGCSGVSEEKEVTEISVGDKTYKVVEASVNELTESLNKTTNTNILKEDMDFFNKMINYNKK